MAALNESDTRIVKTLLSIAKHASDSADESLPLLVTEIFDPRKVSMARGNLPRESGGLG